MEVEESQELGGAPGLGRGSHGGFRRGHHPKGGMDAVHAALSQLILRPPSCTNASLPVVIGHSSLVS